MGVSPDLRTSGPYLATRLNWYTDRPFDLAGAFAAVGENMKYSATLWKECEGKEAS